ncbi:MAG: RNA-directed DNA polymerase, partial [Mesoflavibacter sp.]|nr:RNA-directed DNA polymerase [Mesoflavibacter sp.]
DFRALSLLDTGNSFKSLISREILEKHNIPYCPVNLSAYSVDLKLVQIIGKVELSFKFVGSNKEFKELFFVPNITSKIVNLGSEFLCSNKINLLLDQNQISIQGEIIPLHTEITDKIINEFHKIPEISGDFEQQLPEKPELPGLKLGANGSGRLRAQRFNCKLTDKTEIYPGGTTVTIKLEGADTDSLWYIAPNPSKLTSQNGIMLIEGVYQPKSDGTCLVNVVSSAHKKITLLAGVKIGHGFELDPLETCNNNNIIGEVKTNKDISGTTLHNRIKFIKEKLNLENNEMIKNQPEAKAKLIKIALDHFDIFSLNDSDIGNCDLLQYDINLTDDARPVKARNISLNPEYESKLKEQIEKWLDAGVISEGLSEWNSPIFAVRKKPAQPGGEGKLRFVIDFRMLNNYTRKVSWPLPLISDNLNRLGKGQIFSTLDLTAAYHAMSLTEKSKPYTAFTANGRQYIFHKLPFGLCNAHQFSVY